LSEEVAAVRTAAQAQDRNRAQQQRS